jgi:hypothetical protein
MDWRGARHDFAGPGVLPETMSAAAVSNRAAAA